MTFLDSFFVFAYRGEASCFGSAVAAVEMAFEVMPKVENFPKA
jgi:hypothetical protein